jgi:hypothetical protein
LTFPIFPSCPTSSFRPCVGSVSQPWATTSLQFVLDVKSRAITDPVEQLERSEAMEPFDRLRADFWNDWNSLANLNDWNVAKRWNVWNDWNTIAY